MLKYILAAPAAIVCSIMLAGCGQSYSSAADVVNEMCNIVESINDEASAKKAVSRCKDIRPAAEKYEKEIRAALTGSSKDTDPKLQDACRKLFGIMMAKHQIISEMQKKVPELKEAMEFSK